MGRPRGRGRRGVEGGVTGALRGHDGRDGQGVDSAARGLLVAVIAAGTAPPSPPPQVTRPLIPALRCEPPSGSAPADGSSGAALYGTVSASSQQRSTATAAETAAGADSGRWLSRREW